MVNIDDKDAFEKMICVEGEEYREYKTRDALGDCSFDAFLEAWKNISAWARNAEPPICMTVGSSNNAIYGLGGWNRYAVMNNGSVQFMRDFSTPSDIAKAQECGFEIV